jgi:hypothetical protein
MSISPDSRMLSRGLRGGHSTARRLSRLTTNGNQHEHPDQSFIGGAKSVDEVRECPSHQVGTITAKWSIPFSPPSVQLQRQRSQGGNKYGRWQSSAIESHRIASFVRNASLTVGSLQAPSSSRCPSSFCAREHRSTGQAAVRCPMKPEMGHTSGRSHSQRRHEPTRPIPRLSHFSTPFRTPCSFALREASDSTFVDQSQVGSSEKPGRPLKWLSATGSERPWLLHVVTSMHDRRSE